MRLIKKFLALFKSQEYEKGYSKGVRECIHIMIAVGHGLEGNDGIDGAIWRCKRLIKVEEAGKEG